MHKKILVYSSSLNVLEDYVDSLQFFDGIVELMSLNLNDLHKSFLLHANVVHPRSPA